MSAEVSDDEISAFMGEGARQKKLGAYYTPELMASKMVEWAIRKPSDQVLDTSFGGLSFLTPAALRLRSLASRDVATQLHGCDLDEQAHVSATQRSWLRPENLMLGDFFAAEPGKDLPRVEALVGNPPYIRYQGFNASGGRGHELAAAAGIKLTRLASSWAPFVIHSASFVTRGGRMALVLPAELLHAQYAVDVLGFIQRGFEKTAVVVFEQRVFPGALEEVVLLFAEGRGEGQGSEARMFAFDCVEDLDIDSLASQLRQSQPATPRAGRRGKLLAQLLPSATQEQYAELDQSEAVIRLGDIAAVDIGSVTGANHFFLLRDGEHPELHPELLRTAVSKAAHISGALLTTDDVLALRDGGARCQLFYAHDHVRGARAGAQLDLNMEAAHSEEVLRSADDLLADGEALGIHERYKCRVRSPWWSVPRIKSTPDLLLTYFSREHPRLAVNEASALNTNTLHGVRLRAEAKISVEALAVGFMNSLTLLSTELVGRSYGGGVLKLEPTEAEAVLLPRFTAEVGDELAGLLPRVDALVRARDTRGVLDLVDPIVLGRGLDLSLEIQAALRAGAERLRARRSARGKAPK